MSDPELRKGAPPRAEEGDEGEAQPAFRVIDRRRFAADGSEKEAAPAEPAAAPESAASETPRRPAAAASSSAEAREAAHHGDGFVMAEKAAQQRELDDLPEPSFSTLLISLSTQALMHLGEIPDPMSGAHDKNLPAAKSLIDILAVLERKTAGNLDAGEASLLERILYDLRMRFVEVARS